MSVRMAMSPDGGPTGGVARAGVGAGSLLSRRVVLVTILGEVAGIAEAGSVPPSVLGWRRILSLGSDDRRGRQLQLVRAPHVGHHRAGRALRWLRRALAGAMGGRLRSLNRLASA